LGFWVQVVVRFADVSDCVVLGLKLSAGVQTHHPL
jgi:hypothetical protein